MTAVPTKGYPGRRPWIRGRDALPYQRTRFQEHSGVVVLAVVMLLALAVLALMILGR